MDTLFEKMPHIICSIHDLHSEKKKFVSAKFNANTEKKNKKDRTLYL